MNFSTVLQYILSGITPGSIYAIIAIGFNIIYNTTGIINFAQGEFLVIGALSAISFTQFLPLPLAIVLAVILTSLLGASIELVFIRVHGKFSPVRMIILQFFLFLLLNNALHTPFLPQPWHWVLIGILSLAGGAGLEGLFRRYMKPQNILAMIIITIGVSLIIRETALHIWDEKVRALPYFTGSEVSSISFFGANISPQVLWVLGTCAVIVVGLTLFFRFTLTGKAMRACAANKTAARLCGINVQFMVTLSFIISAGTGALAGCVISPLTQTQYNMGAPLAIKGFTVAILGGLGNSLGAVGGGLLLGILESFSISILPNAFKDVVTIIILLIILFFKPSGLFGNKAAGALKEF